MCQGIPIGPIISKTDAVLCQRIALRLRTRRATIVRVINVENVILAGRGVLMAVLNERLVF
jgi:hypothetical protein